ncbi:MAG TPA: hydroxyacid dehydrogenase [bacterium]|nr:hydroxyacid dehydrogenase [bacterium]HOL47091.1 hydroxyacid dehydrogenase [bacterium]HPQ18991.1 hydroxyacid dehydrogenase [bacterium]
MKILVSDSMSQKGIQILKNAGFTVDVKTGLPENEIVKIISDYDAQIVRSATKVTKNIIDAATKLKVIGRAGEGVDNIDVSAAKSKGIIVMNTPGGNSHAVVELTIGYLFALARNTFLANKTMKEGKWEKKKFEGNEIKDKVLGVIGLGKIGFEVATLAKALGMKIKAYDPYINKEKATAAGFELVTLDNLLAESDYITIHIPGGEKTKNLINKDSFAKMKNGVRIINCARGGIVNEVDLIEAIKNKKVAGAALDVFSKEPLPTDSELLKLDEVILSPHIGASTHEAQEKVGIMIAEQIKEFLLTGKAINVV